MINKEPGASFLDFRLKDGKYVVVDKVKGREIPSKCLPLWARIHLNDLNKWHSAATIAPPNDMEE